MSKLLTKEQRRQLEMCGIEPEKRQLPSPLWMEFLGAGLIRAVLLLLLIATAVSLADYASHREQELQQQQKTMLRGVK